MDRGIIVLCNYVKRKYVISGHYLPALSLRPLGSPNGINCMEYITYNKQHIPQGELIKLYKAINRQV